MADFKELFNRYKTTVETLQKLAECAVCLETLKTPFKLCTRGHMMCCSCIELLKVCPSCEAEFSIETPVGIKNMLEALPKFCRYSSEGCQEIVENGGDHETYCGYRPELCREPNCESVVPVCELLKHYESQHPNRVLLKNECERIFWLNFIPTEQRCSDLPVFLFGHFFWIVIKNDDQKQKFKMMFQVAPSSKPVEDYYVCVKFESEHFLYCYTLKAIVIKPDGTKNVESGKNVSNDSRNAHKKELYCMKIPTTVLHRFMTKEKKLTYSLTFFKEDSK